MERRFGANVHGSGVGSPPMRALEALQTLQIPRISCSSRVHLCKNAFNLSRQGKGPASGRCLCASGCLMPTRRGRSNLILARLSAFPSCLSCLCWPSAGPCPRSQCPTAAPIMPLLVEGAVHRFYSGDLVWASSSGHGNAAVKQ
ncbi:hypothetical protein CORC01_13609 [Colletotrichum orchidophilum]|uniref:Uncharacterized protein n=1 Tax=Colletotrichum orchidophilum TaxID=1209926 RepID=A0A1G4API2_9PEZI|nr:uncharacterized protein CORC01_13609 [Colletotrichum orchidophilum]OHE91090.1 hypothetical protein CORC01_13609 [Colletotrichum orchidophilum]